ncbi:hypothetical protein KGQ64_01790 [bacterium]|nr:hypothetical protein [bacterium]
MGVLKRWGQRPSSQRAGRRFGKAGRRWSNRLLSRVLPLPRNHRVDEIPEVRTVLLVRPNLKIGNTILSTPFIPALRAMFPGARLLVLGSETSGVVLENLPVDGIHVLSRAFVLRPWRLATLLRRLRAEKVDVAVEAGMGSFSGSLFSLLSGARYRVGCEGSASRLLNVRVPRPRVAHVRDRIPEFVRSLGGECSDELVYRVSAEEDAAASRLLADPARADQGLPSGFLAIFVGGHLDKRLPDDRWVAIVEELDRAGARFVVLAGPEEHALRDRLAARPELARHLLSPQPLRIVAAVMARAALVVTTDSGPMHLASALGRPTIALLERERSRRFVPRGADDRVLMSPRVEDVTDAVRGHPRWATVTGN